VWLVSSLTFVLEHRHSRRMVRVVGIYLALSCATFVAGACWLELGGGTAAWALLSIAVLVRKGIVPLHSWMPESFEHGHLVPTILFTTPQLGTYVTAVVLLPRAPASVLTTVAVAALVTAVYAALLGLAEADARRAVGYLFTSQSALVLAGIDSATAAGVGGSLTVWLSSALASAGLGLTLASLESRRGRLSLRHHHGGVERMPLLAASFVVMGLAAVGFPATLGFLGHDLLLSGSVERFPHLGFILVGATALNGITALRMYFSLFCGHRQAPVPLALRRRELATFAALALVLIVAGLFPSGVITSRTEAASRLLGLRAHGEATHTSE
jgi:NADH-quinone oxidoreductase subunit M